MPETAQVHITARDIRRGDRFILHGYERVAANSTWPLALRGHVHIEFEGGGDAIVPADRPITVTRSVPAP